MGGRGEVRRGGARLGGVGEAGNFRPGLAPTPYLVVPFSLFFGARFPYKF